MYQTIRPIRPDRTGPDQTRPYRWCRVVSCRAVSCCALHRGFPFAAIPPNAARRLYTFLSLSLSLPPCIFGTGNGYMLALYLLYAAAGQYRDSKLNQRPPQGPQYALSPCQMDRTGGRPSAARQSRHVITLIGSSCWCSEYAATRLRLLHSSPWFGLSSTALS